MLINVFLKYKKRVVVKLEILIIYVWIKWIKISCKEISKCLIRSILQLLHPKDLKGRHDLSRTGKSKFVINYRNYCNCGHGNTRWSLSINCIYYLNVKYFLNTIISLYISHFKTNFKKRLWHRCFTVSFALFSWTVFLQNISRRLLLFV